MDKGFVKVPRGISGWREFSDPALFYAYFALMSNVRFTETVIEGIPVRVGQLLISKSQLSELFGMSVSRTRSTLERFERMGGIKKQNIRNKYTLITVLKPFLTGEKDKNSRPENKSTKKQSFGEHADISAGRQEIPENKKEEAPKNQSLRENNCDIGEAVPVKDDTAKEKSGEVSEKNTDFSSENGENAAVGENKTAYGKFSNVYLTAAEYEEFRGLTPNFRFFIDSLSARLINSAGKKYSSHYALLINNFNEDKLRRREYEEPEKKFGICSSNASYDIQRAEERAKTVPKLKKRERR